MFKTKDRIAQIFWITRHRTLPKILEDDAQFHGDIVPATFCVLADLLKSRGVPEAKLIAAIHHQYALAEPQAVKTVSDNFDFVIIEAK